MLYGRHMQAFVLRCEGPPELPSEGFASCLGFLPALRVAEEPHASDVVSSDPRGEDKAMEAWFLAACASSGVSALAQLSEASSGPDLERAWASWDRTAEIALCTLRCARILEPTCVPRGNARGVRLQLSRCQPTAAASALSP